eukprot:366576-Chlamydomonas_euryale.AAC.8
MGMVFGVGMGRRPVAAWRCVACGMLCNAHPLKAPRNIAKTFHMPAAKHHGTHWLGTTGHTGWAPRDTLAGHHRPRAVVAVVAPWAWMLRTVTVKPL